MVHKCTPTLDSCATATNCSGKQAARSRLTGVALGVSLRLAAKLCCLKSPQMVNVRRSHPRSHPAGHREGDTTVFIVPRRCDHVFMHNHMKCEHDIAISTGTLATLQSGIHFHPGVQATYRRTDMGAKITARSISPQRASVAGA